MTNCSNPFEDGQACGLCENCMKKFIYKEGLQEQMNILVLGGYGTIGKALISKLFYDSKLSWRTISHKVLPLLDDEYDSFFAAGNTPVTELRKMIKINDITHIINLVGVKTNIKLNKEDPVGIFSKTVEMNHNVMKACINTGVQKVVNIISSCAYGESEILKEENFLKGNIHESVRPHGEAKKMVYLLGQFYKQQYGLNVVCVALNNVLGGSDWRKPDVLKVGDSIVKKVVDAHLNNAPHVVLWGTGKPRREFIYYRDAAEGILKVCLENNSDLLNIGTGLDYSICEVSQKVKEIVGYKGEIIFDTSKADGQMKKLLDVDKQARELNWYPLTLIEQALHETVRDYWMFLELK